MKFTQFKIPSYFKMFVFHKKATRIRVALANPHPARLLCRKAAERKRDQKGFPS